MFSWVVNNTLLLQNFVSILERWFDSVQYDVPAPHPLTMTKTGELNRMSLFRHFTDFVVFCFRRTHFMRTVI